MLLRYGEKFHCLLSESEKWHAPDLLHSTDFFCLLLILYSQYLVYSTEQLGPSRIITTPFRARITDSHVSLLNCVT
jgi:hypothetical protein